MNFCVISNISICMHHLSIHLSIDWYPVHIHKSKQEVLKPSTSFFLSYYCRAFFPLTFSGATNESELFNNDALFPFAKRHHSNASIPAKATQQPAPMCLWAVCYNNHYNRLLRFITTQLQGTLWIR